MGQLEIHLELKELAFLAFYIVATGYESDKTFGESYLALIIRSQWFMLIACILDRAKDGPMDWLKGNRNIPTQVRSLRTNLLRPD